MGSNVPQTKCPIDITVQMLANKWTIAILRELLHGPKRPSDLERNLRGISAKTLSERLHDLQAWGLVRRESHPEVPPRVEYSLTEMGLELRAPLKVLKEFGSNWLRKRNESHYGVACDLCTEIMDTQPICPSSDDLRAKKDKKDPQPV
jgi:DNA-binding HxlR family transcriptional regulator